MRITEILAEAWSQKYKSSINCSHPKGFSQKAHCAGKKKQDESVEMEMVCESCGMCETHGNITEIKKGAKDSNGFTKCWPGKHAEGTKKGRNGGQVRNCVPNEGVAEGSEPVDDTRGFVRGEVKKNKDGSYVATNQAGSRKIFKSEKSAKAHANSGKQDVAEAQLDEKCWDTHKQVGMKNKGGRQVPNCVPKESVTEDLDAQFDVIEEMVESLAFEHGVDAEVIWEDFESVDDSELLETAAWRRKEGKSKKGGLNAKGVASYRRENPGSKLQTAVTTKPSKLKPGSKAAKRRKSFCARMGGVKGPMKKPNGKPTRKALALRKWNC